ncbi:pentapeptide repeat-containing protein [Vibrio cidicii]|uniref:pentapeptide repeat-containing protein n=1 Tax=Vibrio cidicii TaxID=1763883 RepID=UPI0018C1CF45|nr:pentapeptide repeat-containing protein [Vibrio cidicii]
MKDKIELESKLIEQEHRLFNVLMNMYQTNSYEPSDPRKIASRKALFYKLIFGTARTTAFGGIVAFGTLYFSGLQTNALFEQNNLIKQELLETQRQAKEAFWSQGLKRKTELVNILYTTNNDQLPMYSPRLRSESVVEYIYQQSIMAEVSYKNFLESGNVSNDAAMYKFGVNLDSALLSSIQVNQIDFRKSVLVDANASNAIITYSSFKGVKLDRSNFSNSKLLGSDFSQASMFAMDLTGADLSGIKWDKDTVITYANIHDVKNAPEGFYDWAIDNGALDEPNKEVWHKKVDQLKKW